MALNDLTHQNIQDTYQKVVQTDGTNLADGTGSLLPISFDGNDVIIPGALRAQSYIVSESIVNISSGSTAFGDSADDSHTFTGDITASANISASGIITAFSSSVDHLNVDSTLIVDSLIITGSNTFTNWGNFKNRMPQDNRYFTVTTDPTAPGGWREVQGVPGGTTGSAPHLHVQLSGSGQVGIGLLNPQATLHVSESSNDFGALYIQGNVTASGNISASGTVSMLTASIGGGAFTSASLAGASIGNVQSMTSTTTVPTNTNLILYGPITVGTSALLDIAVDSQVLVKDLLNA